MKTITSRNATGLDGIPPKEWKTKKFVDIFCGLCNAVYKQSPKEKWMNGCLFPFPKKGDLRINKCTTEA